MEPASDPVVHEGPQAMNRQRQSERTPVRAVYGFPVAANQYSVLTISRVAVSKSERSGARGPQDYQTSATSYSQSWQPGGDGD